MVKTKDKIAEIYNELHKNFYDYIPINKLAKKTGYNWRTIEGYLKIMKKLNLFHKPICEWHDEMDDEVFEKGVRK